jgi:hypothetical protein
MFKNAFKYLYFFTLLIGASFVEANFVPGEPSNIVLSNDNTNHFVCENGLINDVIVPAHIPHELNILRGNAFFVYKMRRKQAGIQHVEKSHTLHIVCNSEVYSFNVTQSQKVGKTLHLGNSDIDEILLNANKLQEMSVEDIMVEMFLDAYNNDLPPNYSVKDLSGSIQVLAGIKAEKLRSISLNGIGLRLVEFSVTSNSEINLYKTMFMKKEFSKKMRMLAVVPEKADPNSPARLFIIEDK